MAGTIAGGKKAAETNLANDPDFYKRIGSLGGKAPYRGKKGFAANPVLASIVGTKGGRISKRRKVIKDE